MIVAVILAGGSGTRLWPSSREACPKQFLPLLSDETLFQQVIKRLKGIEVDSVITVCNESHRFLVVDQTKNINQTCSIILEPLPRSTAPAIALAAQSLVDDIDSIMLVLPSDHYIEDSHKLKQSVDKAIPIAKSGKLVAFGVKSDSANSHYGYIRKGCPLASGFEISAFIEKPALDQAMEFSESGEYFWNTGIYMFEVKSFLSELELYRPDIFNACKNSISLSSTDGRFTRADLKSFENCPNESIDYAVFENTKNAAVVPLETKWSDLGGWRSLFKNSESDSQGNVISGDVIAIDTKNSYIRSDSDLVSALGVEDLVIVKTKDALLVSHFDAIDKVKLLTEQLREKSRQETETHRDVFRPWGKYEVLDSGDTFCVKKLTIEPKAKLSLQKHLYRSEHWVVIEGRAKIKKGSKTLFLKKDESIDIAIGEIHSIENPDNAVLEIIEIQSGSYLSESDIIRFNDIYGRDIYPEE